MMMAGPPCIRAHMPKKLERCAAEALSQCMLNRGISSSFRPHLGILSKVSLLLVFGLKIFLCF